jgi:GTP-binding protein EngB required for normal cell division
MLSPDDLRPLERLFEDTGFLDPRITRVLLAGVFKAGKSTLVNALFGQALAPADVFEMTSWVARYWPSEESFCRIWPKCGDSRRVKLEKFLRDCESRNMSANELAAIDHVDIGVRQCPVRATLIDAPGLGSKNSENEKRLLAALQDADLVAWTVDVNAIGDIREAALIRRLLGDSVPLIVILTKCDSVDTPSEISEIKTWLESEFELTGIRIFETSARQTLSGKDGGVRELQHYLNTELTARSHANRARACEAHRARMYDLANHLMEKVGRELDECSGRRNRFANVAASMRESVQSQLEQSIRAIIRDNLFGQHRDELEAKLGDALKIGKSALSPEKLTAMFQRVLGTSYLDAFWRKTMTGISTQATELWAMALRKHETELRDCFEQFQARAASELTADFAPEALAGRIDAIAAEAFGTALTASIGLAGVATVWAAALGPHAATITLGAAASGVGIPMALMGLAVSAGMYFWKRNDAERIVQSQAQQILSQYSESVLREIIEPHVFPQLAAINRKIEDDMVFAFEEAQAATLPDGSLENLAAELTRCRTLLAQGAAV